MDWSNDTANAWDMTPDILHWYHGLEFLDTWRWVLLTGKAFAHHTDESLQADMEQWLNELLLTYS